MGMMMRASVLYFLLHCYFTAEAFMPSLHNLNRMNEKVRIAPSTSPSMFFGTGTQSTSNVQITPSKDIAPSLLGDKRPSRFW
jgi:hypothetical protein